jgi:hypothetical protein
LSYTADALGRLLYAVEFLLTYRAGYVTIIWEHDLEWDTALTLSMASDDMVTLRVTRGNELDTATPDSEITEQFDDVATTVALAATDVLTEWGEEGYKAKWENFDFPTERLASIQRLLSERKSPPIT